MGFRKGRQYATTWYNRGLHGPSGKYSRIECFDEALKRDPEYKEAWYEKGLRHDSEAEEAVKCFDKVIALDPKYEDVWYEKGKALSGLEKYEEAIECFDKAIELDPDNILSWFKKGVAYFTMAKPTMGDEDRKNYEEALKCFEESTKLINTMEVGAGVISYVVETKPFLATIKIFIEKGRTFLVLKRPQEALECFDKALELDSEDWKIWHLKSQALQELEKHDESNKCFERSLELGFQPGKEFLYRENPDDLTAEEAREFQSNEEKVEDDEFKKDRS